MHLGIDVGSVTVKLVLLDEEDRLIEDYYARSQGEPISTVIELLEDLFRKHQPKDIESLGTAGSGGRLFSRSLGGVHYNELVAQAQAVDRFYPQARTVIEIGGQDSKLLILGREKGKTELLDFALNNQCSAGTGSFLDQQAERLGYSIEEFSQLALESDEPPQIAGRCSVFAKSDIIHLQQIGTKDEDIINGLCYAVARNFVGDIGRGKEFRRPIIFQGGVSRNQGMVRAFEDVLDLKEGELIIPDREVLMTAIGAAALGKSEGQTELQWPEKREELREIARSKERTSSRDELSPPESSSQLAGAEKLDLGSGSKAGGLYLGIDVGSISTNLVAVDERGYMVERVYLKTQGDPIDAVQRGLLRLRKSIGGLPAVKGLCVTGSGREMIGGLTGADLIRNEITAQATAAAVIDPEVDTVFEIGGQDSKYIRLEEGTVVDFTMNKACAAGTGSFLEEQAARLDIQLEKFGQIALGTKSPVDLGERCTVFMESDLVHYQQRGAGKEELVAGLAYSIAVNYLNRVVGDKNIGTNVLFQGGVASNEAVLAAFRELLPQKRISVPPQHDVTGAYGAALLAIREMKSSKSKQDDSNFYGFDFSDRDYELSSFVCQGCSNRCEIKKVQFADRPPLFYGSRCGKYEAEDPEGDRREKEDNGKGNGNGRRLKSIRSGPKKEERNLFTLRRELVWGSKGSYRREEFGDQGEVVCNYKGEGRGSRRTVGIPRALVFWDVFPYWLGFFQNLNFEVVLSGPTSGPMIRRSVQHALAESCLPAKVAHGHIRTLVNYQKEKGGLDYLFIPSIVSREHDNTANPRNYNCPLVQGLPYTANGQFNFDRLDLSFEVIKEPLHFYDKRRLKKDLRRLGQRLGVRRGKVEAAHRRGKERQEEFRSQRLKAGQRALKEKSAKRPGIVIISRSYNGSDQGLNMDIPSKLKEKGAIPIPMDFLPLEEISPDQLHPKMQWDWGKRGLSAAKTVAEEPHLHGLYLSHFRCGPDSFLAHYIKEILAEEPLLQIELDEHTADAGIVTRCEAFLDSLRSSRSPLEDLEEKEQSRDDLQPTTS